jgi:small subunit ribosomal protein S16
MVRIRMQRHGRTHRPFFRICAIDQRTRRNGVVIESLGWYNPVEKDPAKQLEINAERVGYWLSMGAQPSETVEDMLGRLELLPAKRRADWERRRAAARARVTSKVSLKRAETAVAEMGKLAGSAGADLSGHKKQVSDAFKAVQVAVAAAAVDAAEKGANEAEAALASARKAEADFQAAKKQAEEAAAAAAAAAAAEAAAAAPAEEASEG